MTLVPTGRANLYRSDGSRRSDAEVLAEIGDIGLRIALLDEGMHRRAESVEVDLLYPPRLFLSYKWGGAAENAWVFDLASRLTNHGWEVVFDRWRDETLDRSVEEFVSRLAASRIFVAVLSPSYIASAFAPSHPTWVFDELQCALVIAPYCLRLIGIVPPDDATATTPTSAEETIRMPRTPAVIVQAELEPEFDEVHVVHDHDDLERFLDASLTYAGPRLGGAERAWIGERLGRDSDEPSLREIVKRYPFVSGAWRRLVVLLRDRDDLQPALDAARDALQAVHEVERLPFLHEQIELLKRCGDRIGAAQAATQLIDRRSRDWVAHFHLGDLLYDANDMWAARSHLLLACREADSGAEPHNMLGVVYMALGLLGRASETLDLALRIDANFEMARRNLERVRAPRAVSDQPEISEVSGPLPGCSKCDAIFVQDPDRPLICAKCGASRSGSASQCQTCAAIGIVPIIPEGTDYMPVKCPICRTGTITSKGKARL
jgi:hypothetical protein